MAIQTAVETALYEALTAAAGASIWGDRVYVYQAPFQAETPYLVFWIVAGGIRTECRRDHYDADFWIECVADDNDTSLDGADAIEAALHRQKLSFPAGTGWTSIFVRNQGAGGPPENVEGRQIYRRGGMYRILVSKQG